MGSCQRLPLSWSRCPITPVYVFSPGHQVSQGAKLSGVQDWGQGASGKALQQLIDFCKVEDKAGRLSNAFQM